jgi:uncharacterized protein YecE (DUF72 family)
MKIYAGTSGFGHAEWKGKFYPEKIRPGDMLRFYAERLGTVEINNTFYHMPSEKMILSWAAQVPPDFVFAIKAPQVITHRKQLRHVSGEIERLLKSLSVLGSKQGPVLFQFPKSFSSDTALLREFLSLLPRHSRPAFEFRSPTWHTDEVLGLLTDNASSLCIADTDEQTVEQIKSTADWGYLRLRRSDYTDADLSIWAGRILSQQWEQAFVFFKHEDEAKGPEQAMRFLMLIESLQGKKGRAQTRKVS